MGYDSFHYDADGLGSGVRGDAININDARRAARKKEIRDVPFRGSATPWKPDSDNIVKKRLNKDMFANAKAQAWWTLRLKFQATFRAVVEKLPYNADDLISIDPKLDELLQLTMELSQPTYSINNAGKILVDKQPDGMSSPNLADAVMIAYAPTFTSHTLEMWRRLAH